MVRLEENFRSSPQVLRLADELIKANARRKEKMLIARKPGREARRGSIASWTSGTKPGGRRTWVRGLHEGQGVDYRRIAVFYRTNAMSRVVEEALIQAAVPYQIVKGVEFFHRREVKDMLAYLRLLLNPADEVSLLRVINRPARGIGETTVERLAARARAGGHGLVGRPAAIRPACRDCRPRPPLRIGKFVALIEDLRRAARTGPVADIVRDVYLRSGLKDALRRGKGHGCGRERRRAHPLGRSVSTRRRPRRLPPGGRAARPPAISSGRPSSATSTPTTSSRAPSR